MNRDTQFLLMLAFLVFTSGCSGLIPGDNPATDSPTPLDARSFDEAVDSHYGSLRESGRFKLRWVRSVTFPEQAVNRTPQSTEVVVDFGSDRYLLGPDLESQNGIYYSGLRYQEGTTNWQRRELDNGSRIYRRVPPEDPFSVRNYTLARIRSMENFAKQFPLERNGTAVFQGQRVTRYTTDALGPAGRCLLESRYVIENVSSVKVVALVDNRGIIRKFECKLAGETITGERFTERRLWTITGIGVVEIKRPRPLVNETSVG